MTFVPTTHIAGPLALAPYISSARSILFVSAGMILPQQEEAQQLASNTPISTMVRGGGENEKQQQNKPSIALSIALFVIPRLFIRPIGLSISRLMFYLAVFASDSGAEEAYRVSHAMVDASKVTEVGTVLGTIFNKWSFLLPGVVFFWWPVGTDGKIISIIFGIVLLCLFYSYLEFLR